MIVRCGACGAQFEAPGEGRFGCPACGAQNEIRRQGGPAAPAMPETPGGRPPAPEVPSPRVSCPDCGFRFIVGDVATAPCPNCGSEVAVTQEEG